MTSNPSQAGMGEVMVSTIIVNWNTRDLLLQCLGSLLQQVALRSHEIIVVDNGSSDGSTEAVEASFPQVRVICAGSNLGFAGGNNLGMRASRGRYVALVNSDIEFREDCLSGLLAYLEAHPRVGVAAPKLLNADLSTQQSCWRFPGVMNTAASVLGLNVIFPFAEGCSRKYRLEGDEPRRVDVAAGAFWLVRRAALQEVGLLDEEFFFYGEDVDWCRRFWRMGWEVVFVPTHSVIHYGGGSSSKAPVRYQVQQTRARLQFWRKHCGGLTYRLLWLLLFLQHASRCAGNGLSGLLLVSQREARWWKAHLNWQSLLWLMGRKTIG